MPDKIIMVDPDPARYEKQLAARIAALEQRLIERVTRLFTQWESTRCSACGAMSPESNLTGWMAWLATKGIEQ